MKSPTLEAQQKKARETLNQLPIVFHGKSGIGHAGLAAFLDSQIAEAFEAGMFEQRIYTKKHTPEITMKIIKGKYFDETLKVIWIDYEHERAMLHKNLPENNTHVTYVADFGEVEFITSQKE